MRPNKKDELVDKALTVFYRHGFHATGMDTLVAETGISKTSMYKHFRSKEALILATLHRRDELFRGWFRRRIEALAEAPRDRLAAVFDALDEWFASDTFRGCMFIKASAEYQDAGDPIHEQAAEHKRLLHDYLQGLAAQAGAQDPDALARRLLLLKEGAIVAAHMGFSDAPAADARAAALILIEDACGGGGQRRARDSAALVLACLHAQWQRRGAPLLDRLRRAVPGLTTFVATGSEADVSRHLASGGAHLAISTVPGDERAYAARRLADDVIRMYATPEARAANDRPARLHVDHGADFARWHAAAFPDAPDPALTFADVAVALDALIDSGGAAFLPEDLAEPYAATGVLSPVATTPAFSRPLWLVARRDVLAREPAVRALLDGDSLV